MRIGAMAICGLAFIAMPALAEQCVWGEGDDHRLQDTCGCDTERATPLCRVLTTQEVNALKGLATQLEKLLPVPDARRWAADKVWKPDSQHTSICTGPSGQACDALAYSTATHRYKSAFGPSASEQGSLAGALCLPPPPARARLITDTDTGRAYDVAGAPNGEDQQATVTRTIALFPRRLPAQCPFSAKDRETYRQEFEQYLRRTYPGRVVKGPPPGARQPINLIELTLTGPVGALDKLSAQLDRNALKGLFGQ